MISVNVQFSDASEGTIIGYFTAPQDAKVWPNQATIDASDPRYAAYYATLPTFAQKGMPFPGDG